MTNEYVEPFEAGYQSGSMAHNPHCLTSNVSDAFVLGVWYVRHGLPCVHYANDIRKSRGYTWSVFGRMYRVDGTEVTPLDLPEPPTFEKQVSPDDPEAAKMLADCQAISNRLAADPEVMRRLQLVAKSPKRSTKEQSGLADLPLFDPGLGL